MDEEQNERKNILGWCNLHRTRTDDSIHAP